MIEENPRKSARKPHNSDHQRLAARYRAYREKRDRQPHAPGVWVVYFSLAALPLYGVGQSLIPPANVAAPAICFLADEHLRRGRFGFVAHDELSRPAALSAAKEAANAVADHRGVDVDRS